MEGFLQAKSQRIDGPEKALQGRLANRVDEPIDFGDREHGGELERFGNAEFAERGPFSRTGVGVEELEAGVGDLERVGFPVLIVLDEQQVAAEIIFAGGLRRLAKPLRELAHGAEIGFVGSLSQASQLHVVQHLQGQRREWNPFASSGFGRRTEGSVRKLETTCHEEVLLSQHPRPMRAKVTRKNRSRSEVQCRAISAQPKRLLPAPPIDYAMCVRRAAAYLNKAMHRSGL